MDGDRKAQVAPCWPFIAERDSIEVDVIGLNETNQSQQQGHHINTYIIHFEKNTAPTRTDTFVISRAFVRYHISHEINYMYAVIQAGYLNGHKLELGLFLFVLRNHFTCRLMIISVKRMCKVRTCTMSVQQRGMTLKYRSSSMYYQVSVTCNKSTAAATPIVSGSSLSTARIVRYLPLVP